MVDEILDRTIDSSLGAAFVKALSEANGTVVLNEVLKANPTFTRATTRLQVYDAIAAECAKQGIYVHLDNHVSSAGWCCGTGDGNAWFGDKYFDTTRWKRALAYMADHGGKNWPSFISLGLRNELRTSSAYRASRYINWDTWYGNMTAAADAVHAANPDLLIFFSGLDYDSRLRPLFTDDASKRGDINFDPAKLAYRDKIVLEVHDYDLDESNCTSKRAKLTENSFGALGPRNEEVVNVFPLVMSEWGFAQQPDQYDAPFAKCLRGFLPERKVGWMVWVLVGTYYIRQGEQDFDEPWGLLDGTGKEWRCEECVEKGIQHLVRDSLGLQRPVAVA
ncbi:MAG: hypothetical protein Q9169_005004 [Polycauliona sp. 2 TL-2023]